MSQGISRDDGLAMLRARRRAQFLHSKPPKDKFRQHEREGMKIALRLSKRLDQLRDS